MTKGNKKKEKTTEDLLVDLLIVQLRVAGLTQHQIRDTLGVGMKHVTQLTKYINTNKRKNNDKQEQ
jgi:hypothetical protein